MKREPWTAERDEALRQLVESGVTYAEIEQRLSVPRGAAISRAYRRGFQPGDDVVLSPFQLRARLGSEARRERQRAAAKPRVEFPRAGHCVFPIGHPNEADFHFCCAAVGQPGGPYCDTHHRIAYRPLAS